MSRVRTLYLYLARATLIIYDDLSKQAVAYRQMSLLLLHHRRRPLSYSIDLVKIVKKFAGSLNLYVAHYREVATFAQFGSDPFLQNPPYFIFASVAKPDNDTELHWMKVRCLFLPRALPIASASPPYSHRRTSLVWQDAVIAEADITVLLINVPTLFTAVTVSSHQPCHGMPGPTLSPLSPTVESSQRATMGGGRGGEAAPVLAAVHSTHGCQEPFSGRLTLDTLAAFTVPSWIPQPPQLLRFAKAIYLYWKECRIERGGHRIILILNVSLISSCFPCFFCYLCFPALV